MKILKERGLFHLGSYSEYEMFNARYLLSLFFAVSMLAVNVASQVINQPNRDQIRISPFRYAIIAGVSSIEHSINENPDDMFFEVLMEDRSFNEANLISLFKLLSSRFTTKKGLTINVYTSLEAILTPEENDRLDLKGPVEDHERFKFAIFTRNGYGQYFDYGIPGAIKRKRVVMRP